MDFSNKWLTCAQCGQQFLWDAGEQFWYYTRHFEHPPRRCKRCRERNQLHPPRDRATSADAGPRVVAR